METLTKLYRKQGNQLQFWRVHLQNSFTVSFTWGILGSSYGSRIKNFGSYEESSVFCLDFIARMKQSFNYQPKMSLYRVNIKLNGGYWLESTKDDTHPIYSAVETELEHNGNGSVNSLNIDDHILTIAFTVIDSNLALNKIRELMAGFGIGRNRLLFLPH